MKASGKLDRTWVHTWKNPTLPSIISNIIVYSSAVANIYISSTALGVKKGGAKRIKVWFLRFLAAEKKLSEK